MRYDDINSLLERKPWVAVLITLLVVVACLSILFLNYDTKVDPTASLGSTVALRMTHKTIQTLQTHKTVNSQIAGKLNQPLVVALPQVQSPVTSRRFIPLCARCNVPMQAISPTLFECPVCKQRAGVFDPDSGAMMFHVHTVANMCQQGSAGAQGGNMCPQHGSYFCPVCQKVVAPNWGMNGAPLCPYCNNNVVLY